LRRYTRLGVGGFQLGSVKTQLAPALLAVDVHRPIVVLLSFGSCGRQPLTAIFALEALRMENVLFVAHGLGRINSLSTDNALSATATKLAEFGASGR